MSRAMNDYPAAITAVNHVEPVPRRIRAFLGGEKVLDTTRALYVWEWPNYPQYYIPLADVRQNLVRLPDPPAAAIAGLIAFYNEKVDITLDGQRLERPQTHFFPKAHDASA